MTQIWVKIMWVKDNSDWSEIDLTENDDYIGGKSAIQGRGLREGQGERWGDRG